MNEYDSNRILDLTKKINYISTKNIEDANCYILNTCHIREKATEKVYHEVGRVKKQFRDKKKPIVLIVGCVAQAEGDILLNKEKYIDGVIGPQSYHEINKIILNIENKDKKINSTEFEVIDKFDQLNLIKNSSNKISSFLTIQEGCDKFCTFCVVPYTRGSEYSRRIDDILFEAKNMANSGVVEITLLGQNVNAYHGEDKNGMQRDLTYLINKISEIEKIKRITYSTSHPNNMTDKLIELHGSNEKLLPFLHLPVQSGSNKILKLMNRKHTREFYFGIIDKIKKQKKDIALSSDFIIGFPGEEEKDFDDTIDLIEQVQFMNSYSFIYSPRPGTPAADRKQVSLKIQEERLKIAQSLLNEQQKNFNKKFLKKTLEVLISSSGKYEGQVKGRSEFNQSVAIEGNSKYIGNIVPVNITDVSSHSLIGKTKS